MKILVLGGSGFMGRNIVEGCEKLYEVSATYRSKKLSKDRNEWFLTDLKSEASVESLFDRVKPDIVIQAAATTSGSSDIVNRPYLHVTDNAVINSLVLRACYTHKVKHFLFLSCGVMYEPGPVPVVEEDFNYNIYGTYFGVGWTKVYIEKMCEFFASLGVTKHTVIRHSNTYGKYDKYDLNKSHVFGATIAKVATATDKVIIWGTGEEARDLVYAEDVVDFIIKAIEKQESNFEIFNVGLGESIKIKDLVNKIVAVSGKKLTIEHDLTKPTIPTTLALNCQKAKDILGWEPKTDIDTGIKIALNWYNEYESSRNL